MPFTLVTDQLFEKTGFQFIPTSFKGFNLGAGNGGTYFVGQRQELFNIFKILFLKGCGVGDVFDRIVFCFNRNFGYQRIG